MDDYTLELDDEELDDYDENYDSDIYKDKDEDENFESDNYGDEDEPSEDDDLDSASSNPYAMSPEEAGDADGFFDARTGSDYASFGASIDLDSLTDDERDDYEQAYLSSLDLNKKS